MEDLLQKSLQCSVNNLAGDGKYEVCQPIKRGADGYVYRIQFRKTKQHAALKAIPKFDIEWDFNTKQQDYKKFKPNNMRIKKAKNEMQIHQSLKSQFVVRVTQKFEDQLNFYLIMEYFCKGDLSSYIKKKKTLNTSQIIDFGLQIAKGIATLHNQKIVHRDIKPQNILLDDKNKIKICDFGCATRYNKEKNQKLKGSVGTLQYMAPQIIKSYDQKVDIWSYGILLYYLATGKVPFKIQKQQLKQLYVKVNAQSIEKLIFPQQLPYSYQNLIRRILVIDPNERISMQQIIKHPFFSGEQMRKSPKIRRQRTTQSYDNIKKRTIDICNIYAKTANKQNSSSLVNRKNTHMQNSTNNIVNINQSIQSKKTNNIQHGTNQYKFKKFDVPLEKMLLKKKLEQGNSKKSIVCLQATDCKGLLYSKKAQKQDGKTHEIIIDQRGYIKKYIEKGQRVQISPEGRNIKISQGNIVKQYKCNTLHQKYEKVYLAYQQLVQKLKQYQKRKKQKKQKQEQEERKYKQKQKTRKQKLKKQKKEKSIVIKFQQQNWVEYYREKAQFHIMGNRYIINSMSDINNISQEHKQFITQYYIWLKQKPQIPII